MWVSIEGIVHNSSLSFLSISTFERYVVINSIVCFDIVCMMPWYSLALKRDVLFCHILSSCKFLSYTGTVPVEKGKFEGFRRDDICCFLNGKFWSWWLRKVLKSHIYLLDVNNKLNRFWSFNLRLVYRFRKMSLKFLNRNLVSKYWLL